MLHKKQNVNVQMFAQVHPLFHSISRIEFIIFSELSQHKEMRQSLMETGQLSQTDRVSALGSLQRGVCLNFQLISTYPLQLLRER